MDRLLRDGLSVLALSLAASALHPPAVEAQHFPSNDALQQMIRYLVEDGETEGIVLGVLEADGSTRVVSYGSAGPGARPLGPRSRFEIGSITKTFTATLLAEMVFRGTVSLDDPVSQYLSDDVTVPTFEGREITLLDLATHYSGLSDTEGVPAYTPRDLASLAGFGVGDLYRLLSDFELRRAPGDRFEYSNLGVGLLAHVLARASGRSLDGLVEERILTPLGMRMTGFARAGVEDEWMTRGHSAGEIVPHVYATPALEGAGGLRSSALDMLRYLDANVGPPESDLEVAMREAHLPRRSVDTGDVQVGLAWRSYTLNGRRIVTHNGDTDGFSARLAFDPDRQVGVVVLTNSAEYASNLGTDLIVHDPIPERPASPVSDDRLASYAGGYSVGGVPTFVRLEQDGTLTIQPAADVRMRLYPISDSTFYMQREEWTISFQRADGRVSGLVLEVGGRQAEGPRVTDDTPPPRAIAGNTTMSVEDVALYEGVYDIEIDGRPFEYRVYGSDGRLMSRLGATASPLLPVGEHQFAVQINPSIQVLFSLDDGKAQRVTLRQGTRSDSGERRR